MDIEQLKEINSLGKKRNSRKTERMISREKKDV